ncbi:membrane transporter protein, putative [Babesia ovis]|uniref:Membrane transporter protein, putative n=1 Tax=Babesia ovis TaxID=5869 RepID=A0A9W5TDG5_BABOV|nr:membrane transporter protein, putative [Babesia ovis]
MVEPGASLSLLGRGKTREGATDGHCDATFRANCRRAGIAMQRNTYPPIYETHTTLSDLCDEKERSSRIGTKAVIGAALLYVVLGFPAAFSGIALHITSYIGIIGMDNEVGHKGVAAVFLLALACQAVAGVLTAPAVRVMNEKTLTLYACLGICACILGAAMWLHNYAMFLLLYGVGAGLCSGLVLWLPAESVIKNNPHWRGFSCGLMYALMGTVQVTVGPIQLAYLSPWWINVSPDKNSTPRQRQTVATNWFYTNKDELYRTRKLVFSIAIAYLLLTILGISWAFPETETKDVETGSNNISEYVPFAIKERYNGDQEVRQSGWRDHLCAWLLSFFTWQAAMYIHSCWRSTAVLEYKTEARRIVATEILVRCTGLVGRVIWGLVLDSYGWRATWAAFSLMLLAITVTLTQLYQGSFVMYVAWVAAVYFANSAIFCVVPITASQLNGKELTLISQHKRLNAYMSTSLHLGDVDLKPLLYVGQSRGVRLRGNERNGETLGTEPTSATHAVEVRVGGVRHVVVDDDVHTLDIDTPAEQVGGDHDTLVKVLELSVTGNALLLVKASMDSNGWEVALVEQVVQRLGARYRLDEDNDLVKLEVVKEVVKLAILVAFGKLDVVLQKSVKGQFRLVIDEYLHRRLYETLADVSDVVVHRGREKHNLFLLGSGHKNGLDIRTHVELLEALVTLVKDEVTDTLHVEVLTLNKSQETTWCTNEDVRAFLRVLQHLNVTSNGHTSIHHFTTYTIHVLRETVKLVLDLVSKLTSVANTQTGNTVSRRGNSITTSVTLDTSSKGTVFLDIQLLQYRKDENRSFTHTRFSLTKNVNTSDGMGNCLVLYLRRMLETSVTNGAQNLGLQKEVTETTGVDGDVTSTTHCTVFTAGFAGSSGFYDIVCRNLTSLLLLVVNQVLRRDSVLSLRHIEPNADIPNKTLMLP